MVWNVALAILLAGGLLFVGTIGLLILATIAESPVGRGLLIILGAVVLQADAIDFSW